MVKSVLLPLLALLCSTTYSISGELKGSFAGVAVYSGDGQSYTSNFDGTPISGTFDLEDTYAPRAYDGYNDNVNGIFKGQSALTFNILGSSVAGSYSCQNTSDGSTYLGDQWSPFRGTDDQLIDIDCSSNIEGVQFFSVLSLAGFDLFNPDDPTELKPGTIDYAFDPRASVDDPYRTVFTQIYYQPYFGTNVLLTSVIFDTTSVPEPPADFLLLCGVAGLIALRRRQRSNLLRVSAT